MTSLILSKIKVNMLTGEEMCNNVSVYIVLVVNILCKVMCYLVSLLLFGLVSLCASFFSCCII